MTSLWQRQRRQKRQNSISARFYMLPIFTQAPPVHVQTVMTIICSFFGDGSPALGHARHKCCSQALSSLPGRTISAWQATADNPFLRGRRRFSPVESPPCYFADQQIKGCTFKIFCLLPYRKHLEEKLNSYKFSAENQYTVSTELKSKSM